MLLDAVSSMLRTLMPRPRVIVVAVSGGFDSTALLTALAEIAARDDGTSLAIRAVHVNHHLRDAESEADQHFVERHARSLAISLAVVDGSLSRELVRHSGVEAAARTVRYALLEREREAIGADYIATGHHRDDQAETVIMRLITGSGTSRLRAIRSRSGTIIRPLLEVDRTEIEQFLADREIEPRSDRMNSDPRFLRTRIRNEVLPLLRELNPRVEQILAETARQVADEEDEISRLLETAFEGAVERTASSTRFNLRRFSAWPALLRRLINVEAHRLEPMQRNLSSARLRFITASDTAGNHRPDASTSKRGRISITSRLELLQREDSMELRLRQPAPAAYEFAIEPGERVAIPGGCILHLEEISAPPAALGSPVHQVFELDPGASTRFSVRNRRPGDRFHPLGAPSEKKLKDFLIGRRIERELRGSIPLLVCNGAIVWVAGIEVSELFRVREGGGRLFSARIEVE